MRAGDWILYIDADERLTVDGDLRAELAGARDAVAGLVAFRPSMGASRYLEHRLFRNRADLRFVGAIHETIMPDVVRIVATGVARVARMPASIDHLGYEGDLTAKHQRDLPLLLRQLEVDPGRAYLWFQLGRVQAGLGHADQAEQAWSAGVAAVRAHGPLTTPDLPLFVELALHRLYRAALRDYPAADGSGVSVDDLVDEMRATHPDDPLTRWVEANQAMAERRWDDAVARLDGLVDHPAADGVHPVLAYDRRLFGSLAHHGLGVCWLHLDDPERAAAHLRSALADDPDNVEYGVKLALAEARVRA